MSTDISMLGDVVTEDIEYARLDSFRISKHRRPGLSLCCWVAQDDPVLYKIVTVVNTGRAAARAEVRVKRRHGLYVKKRSKLCNSGLPVWCW